MGNHVDQRVPNGPEIACRQFGRRLAPVIVQRGQDDVAAFQDLVIEVEGTVLEDVDFYSMQDGDVGHAPAERDDLLALSGDVFQRELPGGEGTLRVVGDGDVLVAELLGGRHHGGDRVATVTPGAVHVQVAADMGVADQHRQLTALCRFDLARAFSQFRRNVGESEMPVDDWFGNRLDAAPN